MRSRRRRQSIASQNRDSIRVAAGIMLCIPIAFELSPIHTVRGGVDLYRLLTQVNSKW